MKTYRVFTRAIQLHNVGVIHPRQLTKLERERKSVIPNVTLRKCTQRIKSDHQFFIKWKCFMLNDVQIPCEGTICYTQNQQLSYITHN